MASLPLLTVSSARTYRRCAREYHYRYELGRVPAERAASLRFGSLVHTGLEAWWNGGGLGAALGAVQAVEASHEDLIRAEVLLCGYDARWQDSDLEPVRVEVEFRCPLANPATGAPSRTWQLGGKIDAIATDSKGRAWLVEHKTSSEDITPGSEYWRRLSLDAQVSTYVVGARALGFDVVGCVYDVIGKPRHRMHAATPLDQQKRTKAGALYAGQRATDETPDEYRERLTSIIAEAPDRWFARGEVVRLEEEELDAAYDVWAIGRTIRESQLAGRWPRNPDACQRYGRLCDYWPVCSRTGSIEEYAVERPHQELQEQEVAA